MLKSAFEIRMTRWKVCGVATAAVLFLLSSGDRATAQSQGYAAVAVDGHGGWGASLGQSTPKLAGADAVRRCGGDCRVVMTGRGRCVAFADSKRGGYWYGHAYGTSAAAVQKIAMQGCSAGAPAGTCRVLHVNCVDRID